MTIVPPPLFSTGKPRRRFAPPPSLFVLLATLTVFWPVCGFEFVNYDDGMNIFDNRNLLPGPAQKLGYFWTHAYYELYTPVTYTLWGYAARLALLPTPVYVPGGGMSGLDARVFHTLNLVLHLANVALVYALLRRLSRKARAAAAGALLFAIHPVQVESVAWVTGLNNVLSGFFGLWALWLYLCHTDAQEADAPRGRSWLFYTLASASFALALLSKPTVAALPLAALVLEVGVLRRAARRWAVPLLTWAGLSLVCLLIARASTTSTKNVVLPLWGRPFILGDALAFYLNKLIFPRDMTIMYGRSVQTVLGSWWGYATWLAPASIAVGLWRGWPRTRWPSVAAGLFVAFLFPMLGLVPFYTQFYTTVADRYLYLALIGPALALAWLLDREKAGVAPVAVAVIGLGLLGMVSARQTGYWKNSFTLAESVIRATPSDAAARVNVGIARARKGDMEGALEQFRAAVRLRPDKATGHYHLGVTLADTGRPDEAVVSLRETVRLEPDFAEAWFRLGVAQAQTDDTAGAEQALRRVTQLQPKRSEAHYILGVLLANQKRDREALVPLRAAARLTPTFAEGQYGLAKVLDRQNQRGEAIGFYEAAARLDPNNNAYREALARARRRVGAAAPL